jgi:hypothetical protein
MNVHALLDFWQSRINFLPLHNVEKHNSDTTEHVQQRVHLWCARRAVVTRSENSESDRPYLKETEWDLCMYDNITMYSSFKFFSITGCLPKK